MAEQVAVHTSHGRCPYCHDKVGLDDRVACAACLGAHHQACWAEHTRCASCGHEAMLVGERSRLLTRIEACDTLGISPAELEVLFYKQALASHDLPGGGRGIDPDDVKRVRPELDRLLDLHRATAQRHRPGEAVRGWIASLLAAVALVWLSATMIYHFGDWAAVPVVLGVAFMIRYHPPLR